MPASPDQPARAELFPLPGLGFFGAPAFSACRADGTAFFRLALTAVEESPQRIAFVFDDKQGAVRIFLDYWYADGSGVLAAKARVVNLAVETLFVARLVALSLPLPDWADAIDVAYGSWSNEGRSARMPLIAGCVERVSRSGRPGFDGGPFMIVCSDECGERRGRAIGASLAHSGNFSLAAERLTDGRARLDIAEYLGAGEVRLGKDESYESPVAYAALSDEGFSGVSRKFHALARSIAPPVRARRPAQFNSWEAVYFGVTEKTACDLATHAAELGLERFVLDDGWFNGRNGSTAGLGDWTPDPAKFPDGLRPLADHVRALGLDFGLWLEPEMVNEDSDLFRAHPDWVLSAPGFPRATGRSQLVLDLTRVEVRDHLFAAIDRLLRDLPVSYVKWDCNRDLYPAASGGRASASRQIAGALDLMARVRAAHPGVSIESCASGGGRIDFSILRYTDRFWTSDSTDAIERVRIQRRASLFMPPELLGAHVGPSPNHWTGRAIPMAFRCLVALFGHFCVELHHASLDSGDAHTLKNAIAFWKRERALIIDGALVRLESGDPAVDAQMIVAADGKRALLRVLRTEEPRRPVQARLGLYGLADKATYAISEVFLDGHGEARPCGRMSGAALRDQGLDAAPPHAATGRLFLLERT
jgi:alpha-galactosidase